MTTSNLATCCNEWTLGQATPKRSRSGTFTEVQACPTCQTKLRLTFQEAPLLGGDASWEVVAAERA
jgi:hypothetical protein